VSDRTWRKRRGLSQTGHLGLESRAGYQVLVGECLACSSSRFTDWFAAISNNSFRRFIPDDQPGFRELIETAIREKAEWEADYRIVHPSGTIRTFTS